MTPAQLAARCRELLGPGEGPLAVVAPGHARLAAALGRGADHGPLGAAIVSFVGVPARPAERQTTLAALRARLAPGGPLVVVDHNQPRRWAARVVGWVLLAVAWLPPSRGRYPTARELRALGFVVDGLRLASGERLQLVRARRGGAP